MKSCDVYLRNAGTDVWSCVPWDTQPVVTPWRCSSNSLIGASELSKAETSFRRANLAQCFKAKLHLAVCMYLSSLFIYTLYIHIIHIWLLLLSQVEATHRCGKDVKFDYSGKAHLGTWIVRSNPITQNEYISISTQTLYKIFIFIIKPT